MQWGVKCGADSSKAHNPRPLPSIKALREFLLLNFFFSWILVGTPLSQEKVK
jgi:hypothetical protein